MRNKLLAAFVSIFAGVGAVHAETVTIPWSAAQQVNQGIGQCEAYFPQGYGSGDECYVDFPLSIPIGHTIQQIAVLRTTDNLYPGGNPFFYAYLSVNTLLPAPNDSQKFYWTTSSAVPTGMYERHALMAQAGKNFPDAFLVAPYTNYHVLVALQNGAGISAVEVTYN